MNMQYQDLQLATQRTMKMYMRNPHRSISATYRIIRNKSYVSLIGDYPILSVIITTIIHSGIKPSRFQVTYAFNQSDELQEMSKREKNLLLDQLINGAYVQSNRAINCPSGEQTEKTTHCKVQ